MRFADVDQFMLPGGPLRVIAHRGCSAVRPENTLASFEKAIEIGADMIECDVQLSLDRAAVVIHDETLERTTNGRGPVAHQPLVALRQLDAGGWFASEYAGERVPLLAEVLDTAKERILANVELKGERASARALAEVVVREIRRARMERQTVLSSFEPAFLEAARQLAPEVTRASLFNREKHEGMAPAVILEEVGAMSLNLSDEEVSPGIVRECRAHGAAVAVYTVNDRERASDLFRMGVAAVFTDCPDLMLGVQ